MARVANAESKGYILNKEGNPFKDESEVEAGLEDLGLDANAYTSVAIDGGLAIVKRLRVPTKENPEKYFWVTFSEKSDPNQQDDVILGVNGDVLVCQRGKKVAVAERYIEAAKNALYQKIRQLPGEKRKTVAWVQTYPYTIHGECSREDYEKMRKSGTEATRKSLGASQASNE